MMNYVEFSSHFDAATDLAVRILNSWNEDFWKQQRYGFGWQESFSPAECFVHLIQSQQFALSFIPASMGQSAPLVLEEPFVSILALTNLQARHRALSELNLKGARAVCNRFETWSGHNGFGSWWVPKQKKIRDDLSSILIKIPEQDFNSTWIKHPLVELEDTCQGMCHTLFVAHTYYHLGQATQGMKSMGRGDLVPFPFGGFI